MVYDENIIRKRKNKRLKEYLTAYSFILPFMVFLFLFSVVPLLNLIQYSFLSGSIMGNMTFAGFKNYLSVFNSSNYYKYFLNSLVYIIFTIPIGQALSFMLASLLKKKMRGGASAFFESILFLPLLISMVGASIIITYLFSMNGPVNFLVLLVSPEPVNWLGTTIGARTVIIILELWKGTGLYIFVYLSALRSIPTDYFEVCEVEGANPFQTLIYVTIPLVRRTIFFCVTMTFIWQVQIFDSVYVTTLGGPFDTTKTIVHSIYETTFQKNKPGLGAALAVCFLAVILIVTAIQNRFSSRIEVLEY